MRDEDALWVCSPEIDGKRCDKFRRIFLRKVPSCKNGISWIIIWQPNFHRWVIYETGRGYLAASAIKLRFESISNFRRVQVVHGFWSVTMTWSAMMMHRKWNYEITFTLVAGHKVSMGLLRVDFFIREMENCGFCSGKRCKKYFFWCNLIF